MLELLIIIYIVWYILKKRKRSAILNMPKRVQRSKEEKEMRVRTQASRRACDYEAFYSKGRPDHVGKRGDYDPITPNGMVRVRCTYCNADNFVPSGTHTHYHCYFCWEKL